jgi:hypothetical protein
MPAFKPAQKLYPLHQVQLPIFSINVEFNFSAQDVEMWLREMYVAYPITVRLTILPVLSYQGQLELTSLSAC